MKRTGVFISYSHKDKNWLALLRTQLGVLERNYDFSIWDDTKINPGSNWRIEIASAIASAKVAILLISADFLTSDFINEEELPPLLLAAEKEGAVIMPLIVNHCMFAEVDSLSKFQAFNAPGKPVIDLTDGQQAALFVKVARATKAVLMEVGVEEGKRKAPTKPAVAFDLSQLDLSMARISVLYILQHQLEEGATIKELHEQSKTKGRKYIVRSLNEMEAVEWIERSKKEGITYWRLSEKGKKIIERLEGTLLFEA